ncbi:cell division protein DedD [Pragia fontium]|uniref:Cell division protein DedD n=1 Tax=Pragia fontium TaxID=82985 RepID=A0ABQ5LFJ4_9GAMM|nr:cell division protein DedD [Pragia fontium]GKX62375.1 cell division protein DedD [Pragia fontium]
MASQFQNRLVGAVIIVAIGVIVLPSLFDGKKKHYEEEFAAIPLVPKEGDDRNTEILPSVNHNLPPVNPGSTAAVGNGQVVDNANTGIAPPPLASTTAGNTAVNAQPETLPPVTQTKPPESKPEPKPEPVVPKPTEQKPVANNKPVESEKPKEKPPVGQAYIVQLGALKNADKVNELVATLRLSGHRVYTIPATPVQGKITRLVVGPDPSKQKLEAALPELKRLTGLSGQVKAYSAAR